MDLAKELKVFFQSFYACAGCGTQCLSNNLEVNEQLMCRPYTCGEAGCVICPDCVSLESCGGCHALKGVSFVPALCAPLAKASHYLGGLIPNARCPAFSQGCPFIRPMNLVLHHVQHDCTYLTSTCWSCGMRMPNLELRKHLEYCRHTGPLKSLIYSYNNGACQLNFPLAEQLDRNNRGRVTLTVMDSKGPFELGLLMEVTGGSRFSVCLTVTQGVDGRSFREGSLLARVHPRWKYYTGVEYAITHEFPNLKIDFQSLCQLFKAHIAVGEIWMSVYWQGADRGDLSLVQNGKTDDAPPSMRECHQFLDALQHDRQGDGGDAPGSGEHAERPAPEEGGGQGQPEEGEV